MTKFLFFQSFADQVGRLIENEADFRAIAQNRQLIAKIREIRGLVKDGRDGEAQKKKADLPLIYFFGTRKEGVTKGRKAADLDDMGIFTGHDYDELPPGATLRQVLGLIVKKIHDAGYDWKELLALVVLSPRHTEEHPRFRVLLRVPEELRTGDTKGDAERMEALINLEEYGIHSDPGCKPTKARPWYMVDEASIHYLNARVLFGSETEPVTTAPASVQLCECHGEEPFGDCPPVQAVPRAKPATATASAKPVTTKQPKAKEDGYVHHYCPQEQAFRYRLDEIEEAIPDIIERYLNLLFDGDPALDVEGQRNANLFQAACGLRYLDLTADELAAELVSFTTLDEEEVKRTVNSAYAQPWEEHGSYKLSLAVHEVKALLGSQNREETEECIEGGSQDAVVEEIEPQSAGDEPSDGDGDGNGNGDGDGGNDEDESFRVEFNSPLPPVLQLVADQLPSRLHPAVLSTVFAGLATLLREVYVVNYDGGTQHVGNFIFLTLGPHGQGKSFTDRVNRAILRDVQASDYASREKINDYKEKKETVSATGKRVALPKKAYVQIIGDDFTSAGLNQALDMAYKNGPNAPLLWMLSELDLLGSFCTSRTLTTSLLRKTFDNDRIGTLRATQKSVDCPLNMSVTISSTVDKARTWFKADHLLNGTVDRLSIALVPPRETLLKDPIRRDFETVIYEGMKPYVKRLQAAHDKLYNVPEIKEFGENLTIKMGEMCKLHNIPEMVSFIGRRVDVAVRMACILYICEGDKWTKEIEDFVTTISFSQLCIMANLWLNVLKKSQAKEVVLNNLPDHEKIWRLLQDEFTKQDLIDVTTKVTGIKPDEKKVDNKLRQWKCRGKIDKIEQTGTSEEKDKEKIKWRKKLLTDDQSDA